MNECKHCECKEVIKSCKRGCSVVEYILLYHLNKSDTCTLHVFRNVPNWWRQQSGHIGDDELEIVTGSQSFMKLFFLSLWQLLFIQIHSDIMELHVFELK